MCFWGSKNITLTKLGGGGGGKTEKIRMFIYLHLKHHNASYHHICYVYLAAAKNATNFLAQVCQKKLRNKS